MSTDRYTVVDSSQLRNISLIDTDIASITGPQVLALAESRVTPFLLGALLPESLKSAARKRIGVDPDDEGFKRPNLDKDAAAELLKRYIDAIADELKDDPVAVSTLDGAHMQLFLEDEDDFAMLAENLFTDLDTEDTGKITKSMLRDALLYLGLHFGVPPFAEYPTLEDILKKHGAEGEEELGQAQFAEVLQLIMQELANSLAKKPIVVINTNVKINNGSKTLKVLADKKQLDNTLEKIWEDMRKFKEKEEEQEENISYEILAIVYQKHGEPFRRSVEKHGKELGLPPWEASEASELLYDNVFDEFINGNTTVFTKDEVHGVVKKMLEKFVEQLGADPIIYE